MAEHMDLVDENGVVQRSGVPRHEVGLHTGLYMQIATLIIRHKDGRLLVHRRSLTEDTYPGAVDHVCGGVPSGETPEQTAAREAWEEVGVTPDSIRVVTAGLNEHDRYRHLLVGEAPEGVQPSITTDETLWVGYMGLEELHAKHASGELPFVNGFFTDLQLALAALEPTDI
jgi:8-oxo-dGTP pyrophosphatase MutT (NUDIX family)